MEIGDLVAFCVVRFVDLAPQEAGMWTTIWDISTVGPIVLESSSERTANNCGALASQIFLCSVQGSGPHRLAA